MALLYNVKEEMLCCHYERQYKAELDHFSFTCNIFFFGTFAKLALLCLSIHPDICLSTWNNWMDFHEIWYFKIYEKSAKKLKFH